MSLFSLIFGGSKPKTASIAKERLQLIIAHERNESNNTPDFLPALQQELMAVISKYVSGTRKISRYRSRSRETWKYSR